MRFSFHVAFAILVSAAAICPGPAPAAVFERDFVPSSGDGLLTYDDVNQREWLDVTVFANRWSSLDAFRSAQNDPAFDFATEFPELAPGGVYEDFSLATLDDVMAFAQSARVDTSTNNFSINGTAVDALIDLLGATFMNPLSETKTTKAFVEEFDVFEPDPAFEHRYAAILFYSTISAGVGFTGFDNAIMPENTGLMLFRAAVPEPTTITLLGVVISILLTGASFRSGRSHTNC